MLVAVPIGVDIMPFLARGALVLVGVVLGAVLDSVEQAVARGQVQVVGVHAQAAPVRRDAELGAVLACDWLAELRIVIQVKRGVARGALVLVSIVRAAGVHRVSEAFIVTVQVEAFEAVDAFVFFGVEGVAVQGSGVLNTLII